MVEAVSLSFLVLVILGVLGGTLWTRVPPQPTNAATWRVVADMLPNQVNGEIYDLGAGWGGVAIKLARRYPDNPVIGVELSPLPYAVAWVRRLLFGPKNLTLKFGDATRVPLGAAGLVTCYLFPKVMMRLETKLSGELPDGAVVISNTFALPHLKAEEINEAQDFHRSKVYRYVISKQHG